MVSIKLAFVALLAIFACTQQTEAASVAPEPKHLLEWVRAFLAGLDVIVTNAQDAIDGVSAPLDVIVGELSPGLKPIATQARTDIIGLLNQIVGEAGTLYTHGSSALDTLEATVQDCFDAVTTEFEAASDVFEDAWAASVVKHRAENQASLDDAEGQATVLFSNFITGVRTVIDDALACVKPGAANADTCVRTALNNFYPATFTDLFNGLLNLVVQLLDVYSTIGQSVSADVMAPYQTFNATWINVLSEVATCVASHS